MFISPHDQQDFQEVFCCIGWTGFIFGSLLMEVTIYDATFCSWLQQQSVAFWIHHCFDSLLRLGSCSRHDPHTLMSNVLFTDDSTDANVWPRWDIHHHILFVTSSPCVSILDMQDLYYHHQDVKLHCCGADVFSRFSYIVMWNNLLCWSAVPGSHIGHLNTVWNRCILLLKIFVTFTSHFT